MFLGICALIAGFAVSSVAMYFSIIGWAEIFSASAVSTMIYCGTLETGKIVATAWLKWNWNRIPIIMRGLITIIVVMLMLVTSLGIFGYLAKAHSASAMISKVNTIQQADLSNIIENSGRELSVLNLQLQSLDQAVQTLVASGRIRGEFGSEAVRASQSSERERINAAIILATATKKDAEIKKLSIDMEQAKLTADLGPIKYVSELVYGSVANEKDSESMVTKIITVIVAISDPFAIMMLLAAQMSFKWHNEEKTKSFTLDPIVTVSAAEHIPNDSGTNIDGSIEKAAPKSIIDAVIDYNIPQTKTEHGDERELFAFLNNGNWK